VTRGNFSLSEYESSKLHISPWRSWSSSVFIVSECRLDDRVPGFDPRQRQIMFPLASLSWPNLSPTQPPAQWVLGVFSPGVKRGLVVTLTTQNHLLQGQEWVGAIHLLLFVACMDSFYRPAVLVWLCLLVVSCYRPYRLCYSPDKGSRASYRNVVLVFKLRRRKVSQEYTIVLRHTFVENIQTNLTVLCYSNMLYKHLICVI
jgi:hypothetical protein